MPKYIDVEELKKYDFNKIFDYKASYETCLGIEAVLMIAEKMPSADAQEVKHGKWILKHIGAGHYWGCSICSSSLICLSEGMNYCPYCGAKMDLED